MTFGVMPRACRHSIGEAKAPSQQQHNPSTRFAALFELMCLHVLSDTITARTAPIHDKLNMLLAGFQEEPTGPIGARGCLVTERAAGFCCLGFCWALLFEALDRRRQICFRHPPIRLIIVAHVVVTF